MEIPLVQRQLFGPLTSEYFENPTALGLKPGIIKLRLANQNIANSAIDDAAKLKLSKATDPSSETDTSLIENAELPRGSGYINHALGALKKVTGRLNSISSELAEEALDEERRQALQSEQNSLYSEFERITQSDAFKKTLEVSAAIRSSLAYGGVTEGLLSSLRSFRGVLGESYLYLASNGALSNLQQLDRTLARLSGTKAADLSNPDLSRSLESDINQALTALNVSGFQTPKAEKAAEAAPAKVILRPKIQELDFGDTGELSISLRGYSSKDIIVAAVSGLGSSPTEMNQIIIKPPEKDEDDDKKEKKSELEEEVEERFVPSSVDS